MDCNVTYSNESFLKNPTGTEFVTANKVIFLAAVWELYAPLEDGFKACFEQRGKGNIWWILGSIEHSFGNP